jgi:hypothetical protein
MAKVAFIILRVLVGIAAFASMAITGVVIFVIGAFHLLKGGLGALADVVTIFASGLQKSPNTPPPDTNIPLPLTALSIFFLAMFVSVFLPGQKLFLHVVAVMALIAEAWEIWRVSTDPLANILYLPVIVLWAIYYAICLRR